jgi:single-strand DNA-binding protein
MINKVTLLGHLGKDPIVRRTEAGVPVATFSMATSETYKDKDGNKQTKTEWHNIVVWRGLAEVAEKYLKKGSLLYLEGKMTTRSYVVDNITRYTTEIVAENFQMLDRNPNSGSYNPQNVPLPTEPPQTTKEYGKGTQESNSGHNTVSEDTNVDDLPF